MRETKSLRNFNLKDGARFTDRDRPITRTFGPAGEALPEQGCEQEDAAREWLRHLEAGHFR